MNIHFNLKRFSVKSLPTLIAVFIVCMLFVSFGKVARWDLLEQVAMADNYLANGLLYADLGSDFIHGHSVYFPGVAYVAVALKTIGIDYYLVEVMLLLAVIVLLLFMHVLSRYANSFSNEKFSPQYFYPLLIAFSTIVLPDYIKYALEFKPDTIALLMGYLGLSLIWSNKNSIGRYTLGIFLVSIAVVFKQQYLAFLFGLFFAAILVKKKEFRLAVLLVTIFSSVIIFSLISDKNIRFWSIEVLSDDGILAMSQIIFDLFNLVIVILLFFILFTFMKNGKEVISIEAPRFFSEFLKSVTANPWYLVTLCVIGASLLSALKVGGNNGNAQVALAVIFPLAGLVSNHLVKWKMILIAWFGIIYFMQREIPNYNHYRDAIELKGQVEKLQYKKNYRVLTGSDVYYASRYLVREGVVLENYWTNSLIENRSVFTSLFLELERNKYDYLIVENFENNLDFIRESKDYEILFVNSLGIVARCKIR